MKRLILLMFALFAVALTGRSPCFPQKAVTTTAATIWHSEQFIHHSNLLGRDFLIQVARPARPQPSKAAVIYLLVGNALFGEVANMVSNYGYFGDSAPAYVVGIGYPDPDQDYSHWLSLRNRDLLHVRLSDDIKVAGGSGDGAKFQKYLQELRPVIERRYQVDGHRSLLAGHSFGRIVHFACSVERPSAFDNFIICSPSIWAEPQLLDKAAVFYTPKPLKVFIGVGSKEEAQFGEGWAMVKNAQELADYGIVIPAPMWTSAISKAGAMAPSSQRASPRESRRCRRHRQQSEFIEVSGEVRRSRANATREKNPGCHTPPLYTSNKLIPAQGS
jgi:uncharacterized protein